MSRIVLTGATGFLGSHLLRALLAEGHDITVLKRSTSDIRRIEDLLAHANVLNVDSDRLESAFCEQNIDTVIHTACRYGRQGESSSQMLESNVLFGLRVMEAAIKYGVSTFVNTDTFLPPALNAYALAKHQFLQWLNLHSDRLHVINLKLEHMYGPGDDSAKLVPWLLHQLDENVDRVALTSGTQKRDFIYISDVVAAFLTVLSSSQKLASSTTIEVGTGSSVAVKDFILTLLEQYQVQHGVCDTTLGFGDLPYREGEVMDFQVHPDLLKSLGWLPRVSLASGLEKTLQERL